MGGGCAAGHRRKGWVPVTAARNPIGFRSEVRDDGSSSSRPRNYTTFARSGAEESGRYDGDAILPAVSGWARRDDDSIEKVIPNPAGQPVQLSYIPVIDGPGKLDFDREDPVVVALHDEVDLVLAATGAQMFDGCSAFCA